MTTTRWRCIVLTALCCLLALVTSASAQVVNTSPRDIIANPDRFDGQPVTISGTITNLQERVSRAGNSYYTFDLSEISVLTMMVIAFCTCGQAATSWSLRFAHTPLT